MQDGIWAWVHRAVHGGGLRKVAPPALLSLLCASAFTPLLAGGASAMAVAEIGVLASTGSGVLSGIILEVLERARSKDGEKAPELEETIAAEIGKALASGNAAVPVLRAEIATVLEAIDAGDVMMRAAIDQDSEQNRHDIISAVGAIGSGITEMGFLIRESAQATAEIQESLDAQGVNVQKIIIQNQRQSADIRLVRDELTAIVRAMTADAPAGSLAPAPPRWADGCPYRGLLPFGPDDAEVFYGRERLTAELAARLAAQAARGGPVVVTGGSGAGKTSLLRAGLLPKLAEGLQVPGSRHWPAVVLAPGRDPLGELAVHLAALGGGDAIAIRAGLADHPDQAHLAIWPHVLAAAGRAGGRAPAHGSPAADGDAPRLVLIVDQFEQVFTLSPGPAGEPARQAFITALCTAATAPVGPAQRAPALVVIAVRGDFWDQCAAYDGLAGVLEQGRFFVGPMTESELRHAITGPADAAGLHIDSALTGTILSDLRAAGSGDTAGVLPLLSQAMSLTWDHRDGNRLTIRGYAQSGGVSHAVQTNADQVYDSLPASQQAVAREVLRSMTVASRDGTLTRRPVTTDDLRSAHPEAGPDELDEVLEAFAAARLIVIDQGQVQIAHDALLSAWPRLRGWLEDDQATWILHSQLADDAEAWQAGGRDPSFLFRGTQLATARQAAARWAVSPARYPALTPTQDDFLRASERAARRATYWRRGSAAALVVLVAIAAVGSTIAIQASQNDNTVRLAVAAGQLAAQSEAINAADPAKAAELAAASWRLAPTVPARAVARQSLLDLLAQPDRGVLATPGASVTAVAFSPDGKTLATASQDGTARLWDVGTYRQLGAPMTADDKSLTAVAFSPDGTTLATAGDDGTARLWDVATYQQLGAAMTADDQGITAVAFSPDGTTLATASQDGTARLWDTATRRQVGAPMTGNGRSITAVAFSPDGATLATTSDDNTTAWLWDVASHHLAETLSFSNSAVGAVAFSPGGTLLATGSADDNGDGTARLWDVTSYRQIGTPMTADGSFVEATAFSPDGTILATASQDGTARLWDVGTHQQNGTPMTADSSHVMAVAFSPDGTKLATGSCDNTARLWDAATQQQVGAPMTADGYCVNSVAFSPDGKILAAGSAGGSISFWSVATHLEIGRPIALPGAGINAVAFSPDGAMLATADSDGTTRLWDVATRRQIGTAMTADSYFVRAVAFSPDGTMLATGSDDGTARLWDVATHRQVGAPMTVDSDYVKGVAFSPDGTTLATTSDDGAARLWDVGTQQQVGPPLTAGSSFLSRVAFSPDGRTLATAGGDGTARLWNVAVPRDLIGAVCAIAGDSSLTRSQWAADVPSEPFEQTCS